MDGSRIDALVITINTSQEAVVVRESIAQLCGAVAGEGGFNQAAAKGLTAAVELR
jgi:hypothetical protein